VVLGQLGAITFCIVSQWDLVVSKLTETMSSFTLTSTFQQIAALWWSWPMNYGWIVDESGFSVRAYRKEARGGRRQQERCRGPGAGSRPPLKPEEVPSEWWSIERPFDSAEYLDAPDIVYPEEREDGEDEEQEGEGSDEG
jgi:hypothetical protein